MIQRFTCVPTYLYDILIVTNGSAELVESKLPQVNDKLGNQLPKQYRPVYINSFNELIVYLENYKQDNENIPFNGKIFFMFFNGVTFIQNVLIEAIDYYQRYSFCKSNLPIEMLSGLAGSSIDGSSLDGSSLDGSSSFPMLNQLQDCYFYFDASIFGYNGSFYDDSFNSLVTIINDILKKTVFMIRNIKGIVIDDINLKGEKIYPIHCLLRNYPRIERIELSSDSSLLMNHLIT